MKRVICVLCVLGIVLLSTVGVFADPKAVPGTSSITPVEPVVTVSLNDSSSD